MKILVPVKRVVDYNVKIRVKTDGTGVELANVKMSMNPFDEIAVEEALRLKEAGMATEVVVVSIGPQQASRDLAHRPRHGRRPRHPGQDRRAVEPLAVAKILKAVAREEQPGLVILGKQAIDDDYNQTGQMLAALLGWRQATFASKIEIADGTVDVTREVDGGLQTVSLKLPAVVTTDLRLNEPRYASLPNIMKAKKKPIADKTPADYGVDVAPRLKVLKMTEPPSRKAGVKVESAAELVAQAEDEAGVICDDDSSSRRSRTTAHLNDATAKALTAALAARRAGRCAGRRRRRRRSRGRPRPSSRASQGADRRRARPSPMAGRAARRPDRRRWRRPTTPSSRRPPRPARTSPRASPPCSTSRRSPTSSKWSRPTPSCGRSMPATRCRRCSRRDAKKVITVRTSTFAAAGEGGSAPIEPVAAAGDPALSQLHRARIWPSRTVPS